jgi:hypothetical protein
MSADDNHRGMTGAWIVRIAILALLILVAEAKYGRAISWTNCAYAVGLAAMLYFLARKLRNIISSRYE